MENSNYQKALAETTQMYEDKISDLTQLLADERSRSETLQEQFQLARENLNDHRISVKIDKQEEVDTLKSRLQQMHELHEATLSELKSVKTECVDLLSEKSLLVEERRRKAAQIELENTRKVVPESEKSFEEKRSYSRDYLARGSSSFSQRSTIAKICEEVGLQKILSLLRSEDLDVQTHAVKVVANLAAEGRTTHGIGGGDPGPCIEIAFFFDFPKRFLHLSIFRLLYFHRRQLSKLESI